MFVAYFIPALLGGIAAVLGTMVGRILVALGLSFVTYKGADLAIGQVLTLIKNAFSGAPSDVVSLLAFLWVDRAIAMMFAAFTSALAISGIGGSIKRMVRK